MPRIKKTDLSIQELTDEITGKSIRLRAIKKLNTISDNGKMAVRLSEYYHCLPSLDSIFLMKKGLKKSEIIERLKNKSLVKLPPEQIIEFLFDYEKLSTSMFDDITLLPEDIDQIFHLISLFEKDLNQMPIHYIYLLYFKYTIR